MDRLRGNRFQLGFPKGENDYRTGRMPPEVSCGRIRFNRFCAGNPVSLMVRRSVRAPPWLFADCQD
ncbi:hypothetical protein [Nocardia otitidiscaviarum]|uniref:hypothetical protein n=1 Tax=Nocardia otitidiscaviarum TaxID=1823 RepID=UPI0004A71A8C|nr:hypothetical protein [Nocardia otitidiscaviarum]